MALKHKQVASFYKIAFNAMLPCLFIIFSTAAFSQAGSNDCKIGSLPSIQFQSKSYKILPSAKIILDQVSSTIKDNPLCKIVVMAYSSNSKTSLQSAWEHANAVINYLVKRGVSRERFIFNYGSNEGDPTTVDLRVAAPGESGPSTLPSPLRQGPPMN